MSFVHLHTLSEYSLLKSALRLQDLIAQAREFQMPALALTDHMNMSGAVRFYDSCMEAGILPVLGVEVDLEPLCAKFWQDEVIKGETPGLMTSVLLARNNEGYRTLCGLLSRAWAEAGDAGAPFIRNEWLREARGGLIFLSGGQGGEVFRLLRKDAKLEAAECLAKYQEFFGRENVYLEIQWHGLEAEREVMKKQIELSRSLNIPLAATNACLYLKREDASILELLKAIDAGRAVDEPSELTPECAQYYFRSEEEMRQICRNIPEACDNTVKIAEACNVELNPDRRTDLPRFPLPAGEIAEETLAKKAREGLLKRYPVLREDPRGEASMKIMGRLDYELDVIRNLGFCDYFLIVEDYVSFARSRGIPVGPGRGSAVGSLVSYALGITEIDPLEYDLYFERFLNPSRRKMPDIDIDFCERRRGEVIDYIRSRYGRERVAQVATFSTLRSKAALQDCARVLKTPAETVEKISSFVERFAKERNLKFNCIGSAARGSEALGRFLASRNDPKARALLYAASKVEDLPRNVSLHAAAVVISPGPLSERIPLFGTPEDSRTQCDMFAVERMGLLKMDVLGLRTLTIIDDIVKMAAEAGEKIDLENLPANDPAALDIIASGDTIGVFQLESEGMKRVLRRLKPRDFRDIIAVLALYRPGPMQHIDTFISRHNGEEEVVYVHPKLSRVLKETYGIMLYQEQVMQALHNILGYSMSNADIFRQIMSKKKVALMEKERTKFMECARQKKIPPEVAEKLYGDIASFAGYGFNKSHAAAYAALAYRMAYLKGRYPALFCAGLLNAHLGDHAYAMALLKETRRFGFGIKGPDVNSSKAWHSASKGAEGSWSLNFGLTGVRNVGDKLAEAVVAEREKNGPFTSLENFCLRLERKYLQPQSVDNLVKAGCFDFTGKTRRELATLAADLVQSGTPRSESSFQRSFFSPLKNESRKEEWPREEKIRYEQEALGVCVSEHPLEAWRAFWNEKTTASSEDLAEISRKEPGRAVIMGGLITFVRRRTNRRGGTYTVVKMEDFQGDFEVMLWDEASEKYSRILKAGEVWFLKGRVREGRENSAPNVWGMVFKRFSPDGKELEQ
jgi:DNA polymerase-3 subunit alpha